jgi:hypothetical protein
VLGLGLFAAILTVGVLLNLDAMRGEAGCPDQIRWDDRVYLAVGPTSSDPRPGGEAEPDPARLGVTLVGLTGREVYGPAGTPQQPDPEARPERIALACGDGSFQGYRHDP